VKMTSMLVVLSVGVLISSLLRADETLSVATTYDPPLVFYKDEAQTQLTGSTVELVQDVARRLNRTVSFTLVPWKRALALVERGKVDAICCAGVSEERATFLHFPELHITSEENVLFVKKGSAIQIDNIYSNVSSIKLGAMLGYIYGPMQEKIDNKQFRSVFHSPNYNSALRMLVAGRTDVFVGERLVVAYNAKLLGVRNEIEIMKVQNKEVVVSSWPVFLAFSKKRMSDPFYMDKVSHAVRGMKMDGTYERIINKYVH